MALDFFGTASSGTKLAGKSADEQNKDLKKYTKQAKADYATGVAHAAPNYQQENALYAGLAPGDLAGKAMYLNALGLNGSQGNQAATGAFQASPGYQYQLDQALQAVLRNGAATGGVANGNVLEALQSRGNDLANQDWQQWLSRLQGVGQNIYNDYAGQAQALNQLGSMYQKQGEFGGNADLSLGNNLANVAGTKYSNINSARNAGNAESWGAILGGANALTGLFG